MKEEKYNQLIDSGNGMLSDPSVSDIALMTLQEKALSYQTILANPLLWSWCQLVHAKQEIRKIKAEISRIKDLIR